VIGFAGKKLTKSERMRVGTRISPSFSTFASPHQLIPISKLVVFKFRKFFSAEIEIFWRMGKVRVFWETLSTVFIPSFNFYWRIVIFIFMC